jgi:hypothetical protein
MVAGLIYCLVSVCYDGLVVQTCSLVFGHWEQGQLAVGP